MTFSQWQIRVIRDALAAHRLYTPGERKPYLSWFEMTARIEAHSDIELGKDLLRQFVEGVSKTNPGKSRVPESPTLQAIVSYLVEEGIDALSEAELKNERAPAYQAPLRLLQYLRQDLDTEMLDPPPSLNGDFTARCSLEDESPATINIALDCAAGGPLISVTETLVRYFREDRILDTRRNQPGDENLRKHSRGWAILTPEDNLFAFMKEEPYGYNHYYLSFAVDTDLWSQPETGRLVLLRHDYPLEFEDGDHTRNGALAKTTEYARDRTLYFERVK